MRVSVRGWARDHGSKNLLAGKISNIDAREDVLSYPYEGLTLEIEKSTDGKVASVEIVGRSTVTMNGDYMTKVKFSRQDVIKMAALVLRDMTFEEITRSLSGIYLPADEV